MHPWMWMWAFTFLSLECSDLLGHNPPHFRARCCAVRMEFSDLLGNDPPNALRRRFRICGPLAVEPHHPRP